MHEFEGNLLIGGAALKRLHGDLEDEQPQDGSCEWLLSGHLRLSPQDWANVKVDRTYRLELTDGRCGQVRFTQLASQSEHEMVVDFRPSPRRVESPAN
jgi:hypothetical protein